MTPTTPCVQLRDLVIGIELATGGQGSVFDLPAWPGAVLKKYHEPVPASFCAASVAALVHERDHILHEGEPVDQWAAWPSMIVLDGSRTVGFVMPRAPEAFMLTIRGQLRLADLSYLATEPRPLWGSVSLPGDAERVAVLRHLAGAIQSLHHRGIVFGDISFGNILWSTQPRPRVLLLDCDGMQPPNRLAVLPSADTPDWEDPFARVPLPDVDRDNYKLALAVVRILTRSMDARPGGTTDRATLRGLAPDVANRVGALVDRASGPVGSRPQAGEWAAALGGRTSIPVQSNGQRRLAVDAPPPRPDLLATRSEPRVFTPVQPLTGHGER